MNASPLPSTPDEQPAHIGVATMEDNGEIVLQLREALDDGENVGEGYFRDTPGTADHDEVLRHIGSLKPGESKPVPPWPEDVWERGQ